MKLETTIQQVIGFNVERKPVTHERVVTTTADDWMDWLDGMDEGEVGAWLKQVHAVEVELASVQNPAQRFAAWGLIASIVHNSPDVVGTYRACLDEAARAFSETIDITAEDIVTEDLGPRDPLLDGGVSW